MVLQSMMQWGHKAIIVTPRLSNECPPRENPDVQESLRECKTLAASVDLFHCCGFGLLELEPLVMLDPSCVRRERFVEPFRSKLAEDLAVLAFRLVVQRRR